MTSRPKVSVILPTYNRALFLGEAIESVLGQTFQDFQLIVVDDGSTDHTPELVANYGASITYISQVNAGPGAARNTGVRNAIGEWLAFLDSDDVWLPEYLSHQMAKAAQQPHVHTHMTNAVRVNEGPIDDAFRSFGLNVGRTFAGKDSITLERPFNFVLRYSVNYLQTLVFRREVFLRAGLFKEKVPLADDLEALIRMCLQGPLQITDRRLVRIIRRNEKNSNLGSRWSSDQVYCRRLLDDMYRALVGHAALTSSEKDALVRTWALNTRAIGNLYLQKGDMQNARKCYKEAVVLYPSIGSVVKASLAYLPRKVGLAFISRS